MNRSLLAQSSWTVALFISGVTAGMFLMDFLGYYPLLPRLPDQAMIELHQQSVPLRRSIFRLLIASSGLASIALLIFFSAGASRLLLLASLICLGALVLYTNLSLIPLNREIADWAPAFPPPEWKRTFSRMIDHERMRCLLPSIVFTLQLIAAARTRSVFTSQT